jgi:hypothetical protein
MLGRVDTTTESVFDTLDIVLERIVAIREELLAIELSLEHYQETAPSKVKLIEHPDGANSLLAHSAASVSRRFISP